MRKALNPVATDTNESPVPGIMTSIVLAFALIGVTTLAEDSPLQSSDRAQKTRGAKKMNQLDEKIGRTISLRGRAMDAKGSAVLLMPDETPIYIPVLEFWPDEFVGHDIEVRGVLKRKKLIPDTNTGPASQGAQGEDFVLENASWKKVSK